MHPAYSVIFFTVVSGAGYGLLFVFALGVVLGLTPDEPWLGRAAIVCALTAAGIGGGASFFHLGHPERAWRALSQWRSSWLSREAVLALGGIPVALALAATLEVAAVGHASHVAAIIAGAVAAATVLATSKIYATLRAIRQWHNPWVTPGYLALSLMSGALGYRCLVAVWRHDVPGLSGLCLAAIAAAAAVKFFYWRSIDGGAAISTAESATGLGGFGQVRLLDPPHTSANFLLSEMGYRVARKHARRLRAVVLAGGFAVPAIFTVAAGIATGGTAAALSAAAFAAALSGLMSERWLFFAEAKHTVTLYYGASHA